MAAMIDLKRKDWGLKSRGDDPSAATGEGEALSRSAKPHRSFEVGSGWDGLRPVSWGAVI